MDPIFLKVANSTETADDAGVVIIKRVLPTYNEGPYHKDHIPYYMKAESTLKYVPSMAYFSIKALSHVVDRIDFDGCPRLTYRAESHAPLLKSLICFLGPETRSSDIKYVDPLLWGTLIQLYADLPAFFHVYPIPLSDKYLPLLQGIQSTPEFTLITILVLSGCPELTDDNIGELKPLTNLCVLDMSTTFVSSWGIKLLSMCLVQNEGERYGPWGIRIWSMRGCSMIDNKVKEALAKFPLLSVIDLRNTSVTDFPFCGFTSRPDSSVNGCYHPSLPSVWIDALLQLYSHLVFAAGSQRCHVLHVNRLEHPKSEPRNKPYGIKAGYPGQNRHSKTVSEHDNVSILFSNGRRSNSTTHDISQRADSASQRDNRLQALYNQLGRLRQQARERRACINNVLGEDELFDEYCDCEGCENDVDAFSFDRADYIENEIAGILGAQDEAERQARRFYEGRPLISPAARPPNGLRRALPELSPLDTTASLFLSSSTSTLDTISLPRAQAEISRCDGDDWEKSFMFFRVPPPFDSIAADDDTFRTKKQNPDDVILPKRRKTNNAGQKISNAMTTAIMRQMRDGVRQRHVSGRFSSCTPNAKKASDFMDTQEAVHDISYPAAISKNPFLAKKKLSTANRIQSTSPCSTSTGVASTMSSQPQIDQILASDTPAPTLKSAVRYTTYTNLGGGSQIDAVPPKKYAKPRTPPSINSKPIMTVSENNYNGSQSSPSCTDQNVAKAGSINKAKAKSTFDMKAWAKKSTK